MFLKNRRVSFSVYLAALSALLLLPSVSQAAVFYLSPKREAYKPGDSFIMEVRMDTQGECLNAVRVGLEFPNEILSVQDFLIGESILSHWVEKPTTGDITQINQQGRFFFAGGVPGGYCGRVPGDPALTNILGRVVFRVPSIIVGERMGEWTDIKVSAEESKAFLNDGQGTETDVFTQDAKVMITEEASEGEDQWQKLLQTDDTQPEPFTVELNQNPRIFSGDYFLVFWATDKQTGIDHFEVKEGQDGEFVKAESPYLVKNQELKDKIWVKAVDKAGNERLVEYTPTAEERAWVSKEEGGFPWGFFVLGVVLIVMGLVFTLDSKVPRLIVKNGSKSSGEENSSNED